MKLFCGLTLIRSVFAVMTAFSVDRTVDDCFLSLFDDLRSSRTWLCRGRLRTKSSFTSRSWNWVSLIWIPFLSGLITQRYFGQLESYNIFGGVSGILVQILARSGFFEFFQHCGAFVHPLIRSTNPYRPANLKNKNHISSHQSHLQPPITAATPIEVLQRVHLHQLVGPAHAHPSNHLARFPVYVLIFLQSTTSVFSSDNVPGTHKIQHSWIGVVIQNLQTRCRHRIFDHWRIHPIRMAQRF